MKNILKKRNIKKIDVAYYKGNLPQNPSIENLIIKDFSETHKNSGRSFEKYKPIVKKNKVKDNTSGLSGKKKIVSATVNQPKQKNKFPGSTKKLIVVPEKNKKTSTINLERTLKMRKIKKRYDDLEIIKSKNKIKKILSNKSSNKINNAINTFKNNFSATLIQKIFRGYIFRKYNRYITQNKKNNTENNLNTVYLNMNPVPSLYVKKKSLKNKNVLTISSSSSNTNFGAAPPKMLTSPNTNHNSEKYIYNNFKIQEIVIKKNKISDILIPTTSRNKKIEEKNIFFNEARSENENLKNYNRGDKYLLYKYLSFWRDRVYRYIILEKIFEHFKGYDYNLKKGYMCLNGKRDYFSNTNMGLGIYLGIDTTDLYSTQTINVESLNSTFKKKYSNFQY